MIHRNWRTLFILITLTVDAFAIAVSAFGAYMLRSFFPGLPHLPVSLFLNYTLYFSAITLCATLLVGVYRSAFHINLSRQYYLASKAYVYALVFTFASLYVIQPVSLPRRFTILFFALLPIAFIIGRWLLNRFNDAMRRQGIGMHQVLLVGYDQRARSIVERFEMLPELGYHVAGVVSHNHKRGSECFDGLTVDCYGPEELASIVSVKRIDRIFVPSTAELSNGYAHVVPLCRQYRIKLKVLSHEADRLLRMAHVYDIAGITLVTPVQRRLEQVRKAVKRGFDLVGAAIIVVLLSPVFVLTTLAILFESGLPILFKQKRAAVKNGRIFEFFKFRSMIHNADELKESLLAKNETNGGLFKMKNDPRMTRIGKIIRKFSIDELPQLYNVLRGDMSLVGPRPLPLGDFDKLDVAMEYWELIKDRERVKPGMTGLWQVSGRSNLGFDEMIWLDLYYAENQSLLFDLEILFATIPVVVFGRGAY